jgi:L-fucose mutarotase/ribose pyranase (RbsD/FucU family)
MAWRCLTFLLVGIVGLMNPDNYVKDPVVMMKCATGDRADPVVEKRFSDIIYSQWGLIPRRSAAVRIGNTNKKLVVDPTVNNFLAERTS